MEQIEKDVNAKKPWRKYKKSFIILKKFDKDLFIITM